MSAARQIGITTQPSGTWVQADREGMKQLSKLSVENPRASSIMLMLISVLGRHNAVVVSQQALAKLCDCSLRTVRDGLKYLRQGKWITVAQMGPTGTVNAYLINSEIAWNGNRDGIRYAMFSATVVISEDEQTDQIGKQDEQIDLEDTIAEIEARR